MCRYPIQIRFTIGSVEVRLTPSPWLGHGFKGLHLYDSIECSRKRRLERGSTNRRKLAVVEQRQVVALDKSLVTVELVP